MLLSEIAATCLGAIGAAAVVGAIAMLLPTGCADRYGVIVVDSASCVVDPSSCQ
ncbi:MAG: hypothetical protein JO288_04540 [Hyphomicrobiales bacterium]|nr:hypothetical protein [Hyphomicrobiales bacterium]